MSKESGVTDTSAHVEFTTDMHCALGRPYTTARMPLREGYSLQTAAQETIVLKRDNKTFPTTTVNCTQEEDASGNPTAVCLAAVDGDTTELCGAAAKELHTDGMAAAYTYPTRVTATACGDGSWNAIQSEVSAVLDGTRVQASAEELQALAGAPAATMHGQEVDHCMTNGDQVWCTACADDGFDPVQSACATASDTTSDRYEAACRGVQAEIPVMLYDAQFHCVVVGDPSRAPDQRGPVVTACMGGDCADTQSSSGIKAGFRKVYATCEATSDASAQEQKLVSKSEYVDRGGNAAWDVECNTCDMGDTARLVRGEPFDVCSKAKGCSSTVVTFSDPRYYLRMRRFGGRSAPGGFAPIQIGEDVQVVHTAPDGTETFLAALVPSKGGQSALDLLKASLSNMVSWTWSTHCSDQLAFVADGAGAGTKWRFGAAPATAVPGKEGVVEVAHPFHRATFYSLLHVASGKYLSNRHSDTRTAKLPGPGTVKHNAEWYKQDMFEDDCWPSHRLTAYESESRFLLVGQGLQYPEDFTHSGRETCKPCFAGLCETTPFWNSLTKEMITAYAILVLVIIAIAVVLYLKLKSS